MSDRPPSSVPGSRTHLARLFVVVSLFVGIGVGSTIARGDSHSDARVTTAGDLEDHQAESVDPSTLEAESGEMQEGYSDDPEDLVVESEQMDVVPTEQLSDHRGASTDLQDLATEAPSEGFDVIDDGRLKDIDDEHLSAEQLVAKRHLERAQLDAEAARTRYGDMMRDDYPRGAARVRITEHRDETMKALEEARSAFDRAMGS